MLPDHIEDAVCQKCQTPLLYVTALPHPKSPQMRKTTFVCYQCKRTWTYPLAAEIAEYYGAKSQHAVVS
jgi:RNase P subunit RPR2